MRSIKATKTYEKAGLLQTTGAVAAGVVAGDVAKFAIHKAFQVPFVSDCKKNIYVGTDMFAKAADEALIKSGLASKGVKIIRNVKDGGNPQFIPTTNEIINNSKLEMVTFHEMGHAVNKNFSTVGKVLFKMKAPAAVLLIPAAICAALFKRKKVEGEKPEGFFDKATTFIKDNCGKIAFLGFVPILLEEGLASINANKLAKEVLSPENLKKMNKLHATAWLTYAGLAAGGTTCVVVMSKVRDALSKPKEVKS